ncbi:glutathione S-transferase N-terminal domain-containing protein [Francisellaceae bacterium]|nr:glutathione S-transferase N-terminal domain-containing protein [Francisellaceae bacterium]
MTSKLPILYSFRRCPFAMRARLALYSADIGVEICEVALRNKPIEMLQASPKGTVPVLVLPNGEIIDESFEIMMWALAQNDPEKLLIKEPSKQEEALALVNQSSTVNRLIREIKFNDRHPDLSLDQAQENISPFLNQLEISLTRNNYLMSNELTYIDYALFPFVRQLIHIDPDWFQTLNYPEIYRWYKALVESDTFKKIMMKVKPKAPELNKL